MAIYCGSIMSIDVYFCSSFRFQYLIWEGFLYGTFSAVLLLLIFFVVMKFSV